MQEKFMNVAIKEALKAKEKDEVPIGAVIVIDGKIISRAHNLMEKTQLATAHAEVLAINADEKYIDEKCAFDISKCDLIAYSNGNYYSLGKKIGRFGFSVQKNKKRRKK